jgi:hypothetical protein
MASSSRRRRPPTSRRVSGRSARAMPLRELSAHGTRYRRPHRTHEYSPCLGHLIDLWNNLHHTVPSQSNQFAACSIPRVISGAQGLHPRCKQFPHQSSDAGSAFILQTSPHLAYWYRSARDKASRACWPKRNPIDFVPWGGNNNLYRVRTNQDPGVGVLVNPNVKYHSSTPKLPVA